MRSLGYPKTQTPWKGIRPLSAGGSSSGNMLSTTPISCNYTTATNRYLQQLPHSTLSITHQPKQLKSIQFTNLLKISHPPQLSLKRRRRRGGGDTLLLCRCSSNDPNQPPTPPAVSRDWTTSILLFVLWAALMYYVFLLTPNQTPLLIVAGLGTITYAGLADADVWKEFYQYFRESKFIHATCIDFALLSTFAPFWVYNDMTARRWLDKGSWILPLTLIPFLGPAFYLVLRPPLSASSETNKEGEI